MLFGCGGLNGSLNTALDPMNIVRYIYDTFLFYVNDWTEVLLPFFPVWFHLLNLKFRTVKMAMFSKYFYQTVDLKKCSEVVHDELYHSCSRSTLENFTTTIGGCIVFVLPLALVKIIFQISIEAIFQFHFYLGIQIPIIMRANNLNNDVLKQSLSVFRDSFLGAWLISGMGLTMMCLLRWWILIIQIFRNVEIFSIFRKVFGRFYYATVLALPSALGAAVCVPFISDRAVYAYAHGLSAIVNLLYFFFFSSLNCWELLIIIIVAHKGFSDIHKPRRFLYF